MSGRGGRAAAAAAGLAFALLAAAGCGGQGRPGHAPGLEAPGAPGREAGGAAGQAGDGAARRGGQSRLVRVAAAADLKFALDDLIAAFRRERPDIRVTATYGSSGNFATQIANGAPFDIFFAADVAYPRQLAAQGLVLPGSEFRYAVGRIVLWVPTDSPLPVEKEGVAVLTRPEVRHVAIANPRHAPYGRAAEAALRKLEVYEAVKGKLVLGENVAQTAEFVRSGAADAGVIALSLALAPPMRGQGRYWVFPLETYQPMEQGGAILRRAGDAEAARSFRDFVLGDRGRAILKDYGFTLPDVR